MTAENGNPFLSKPFTPEDLSFKVREVLDEGAPPLKVSA